MTRLGWKGLPQLIARAIRTSPSAFFLALLEATGNAISGLIPVFVAMVAGGVAAHTLGTTVAGGVCLVIVSSLPMSLMVVGTNSRILLMEKLQGYYNSEVARMLGSVPTLTLYEDPKVQDEVKQLADKSGSLGNTFNMTIVVLNQIVRPIVLTVSAIALHPLMVFAVLAALPTVALGLYTPKLDEKAEKASAQPGRLTAHLQEIACGVESSAELRVLGAQRWFFVRLADAARGWRRPFSRATSLQQALRFLASLFYSGVSLWVLWVLTVGARVGTVSVAVLAGAITVMLGIMEAFNGLLAIQTFSEVLRETGRFVWVRRYLETENTRHAGTAVPPSRLGTGIALHHVSFSYPGASRRALEDINLNLPAGSVVAVVGENGSGKTTLASLLTGMYDPSDGEVTIDGTPLNMFDITAWRQRCSGAFQDYVRFELTAGKTVGIGGLPRIEDRKAIGLALEQGAAADVVAALSEGLDTQLGTAWGGQDLSGGQWQRLAIARGMMRPHPLLLVLDEPTSALDAFTEDVIFSRYIKAAGAARRDGAVTLLIMHRFSTVAAADLVVVLDAGRVAEVGSHRELIDRGGLYAGLYSLQADSYR